MTTAAIMFLHSLKSTLAPQFAASITLSLLVLILACPVRSEPLDGFQVMQQVNRKQQGQTMSTTTEMILIGNDGQRKSRQITIFTKHDTDVTRKILFVFSPASVKGTSLLTYDYSSEEREDEQWIYLPALHRIKRISAGNRSGSFMGSDFSYGDLTQKSLNAYSYTIVKEQVQKEQPVWIIEAIPKNVEVINQFGYTKSLLIVRKDNFVVIGAIHWLKDKNTLKYNEVKKLEKIEGIWIPTEILAKTVSNGKTIHQTLLINKDIMINQEIADEMFSKRKLKQGI